MCNLKLKFSMDSNIYVSFLRYAHILSKEFDMKRWLNPLHRGEELFSFLLGYSKSRLKRRNRKKSTMLLLLFKSFFWIKKNREEQENSAIKLSRRMKMSGANVWQSHLCCWQRTDCFAATNFFFPRVRCEGALRLPKFLFMAIRVVEFSRRG